MDNDAGLSDWSITVLPTIPIGPFTKRLKKCHFDMFDFGNFARIDFTQNQSCSKVSTQLWKAGNTVDQLRTHQLSLSKWFLLVFSDSLIDCQDPDCCSHPKCVNNHLCYTVEDPVNIARNKSLLDFTMNFWERIRFLVSDAGIQRYAQINHFDPL